MRRGCTATLYPATQYPAFVQAQCVSLPGVTAPRWFTECIGNRRRPRVSLKSVDMEAKRSGHACYSGTSAEP